MDIDGDIGTLGRHPIFVLLFSADFTHCRRLSQFLQISPLPFSGHYAIIPPFLGIEHRRRTDTRGNHGESAG